MNRDQFLGKWKEFKGEVRKQWAKLTEDDLEHTKGDMETLAGRIQQRYGDAKEKARAKLDQIVHRLQGSREKAPSESKPKQPSPPTDEQKKREAA